MKKTYIVLTGLPARGKSIVGLRLLEGLSADGLTVRIFNNGDLRRSSLGAESALAEFYHPDNQQGRSLRDELARKNMRAARAFLESGGHVAILDATNASQTRRDCIAKELDNAPVLYVECVNDDPDLLSASIQRKARLPEFSHMPVAEAIATFKQRIEYYQNIYVPLADNLSSVRVDTLYNTLIDEHILKSIPYYTQIRDILVSDWVRNLYLVRHGESEFNVQGRIGGNSSLTAKGNAQADALAEHFKDRSIPYIFTSSRLRSAQTAAPLQALHSGTMVIALPELDEINSGICEGMRYEDIRGEMPLEYRARAKDKYNYIYPKGEGYVTLHERVSRGFRKALFLSGAMPGIIIIGHQAINRMILSLFMFRREEDVPHIYVPQNEYFHIVATHRTKMLDLVRFTE